MSSGSGAGPGDLRVDLCRVEPLAALSDPTLEHSDDLARRESGDLLDLGMTLRNRPVRLGGRPEQVIPVEQDVICSGHRLV